MAAHYSATPALRRFWYSYMNIIIKQVHVRASTDGTVI